MRRRRSMVLVASGVTCLIVAAIGIGVAATAARAQEPPGSGFGTFSLSAGAQAIKVIGPDPNIVASVPEASAQLRNGPVGYGLASIAWPGPVAANAGSLLLLLGNPVCAPPALPPQLPEIPPPPTCPEVPEEGRGYLTALNYPVRAEARTGSDEPTVRNNSAGAQMTATALDDEVTAEALIGAGEASAVGFGNTRSTSTVKLTAPDAAESVAVSRVNDISLAGGTVTIGSVVSRARGTTDGVNALASGTTIVTDVRIAGQPVTIDRDGVHVLDQGASHAEAVAAVNQALSGFGMQIAFSEPNTVRKGGAVTYTPGSLVFSWTPPGQEEGQEVTVVTVVIGSTTVAASAAPPFSFDLGGGGSAIGGGVLPPVAGGPGGFGGPTGATPSQPPPTVSGPSTAEPFKLASRVGAGWIGLAVLGAILTGVGTRRAAELVLTDGAGEGAACTLEEPT